MKRHDLDVVGDDSLAGPATQIACRLAWRPEST